VIAGNEQLKFVLGGEVITEAKLRSFEQKQLEKKLDAAAEPWRKLANELLNNPNADARAAYRPIQG
jgi:hypothetical protein